MDKKFIEKIKELKKKNAHLAAILYDSKTNKLNYFFFVNSKEHFIETEAKNLVSIANLFPCAEVFELELKERFGLSFPIQRTGLWLGENNAQ